MEAFSLFSLALGRGGTREDLRLAAALPCFLASSKWWWRWSVVLTMVAYTVLVERRVSAFIQDRIGPNRVGSLLLVAACWPMA